MMRAIGWVDRSFALVLLACSLAMGLAALAARRARPQPSVAKRGVR